MLTQVAPHTNRLSESKHHLILRMYGCNITFLVLLGIEFLLLLSGISVMYLRVVSFQILFHFSGAILTLWMVLDRFHFRFLWYLFVWSAFIPFCLEVLVMILELFNCVFKIRYRVKPGTRTKLSLEQ